MGWLEDLEEDAEMVEPSPSWVDELEDEPTGAPAYNMFGQRTGNYGEGGDPGAFQEGAEALAGLPEAALTIGSAMVAEPVAGLAGIGAEIVPGGETGAEAVESTKEAMTFQPRSDYGKGTLEDIGGVLAPVGEFLEGAETFLGEGTLALTGSPGLATSAHLIPTVALEMLGLAALRKPSQAAEAAIKARRAAEKSEDMTDVVDALEPELRSHDDIIEDITKKKSGRLAQDVKPDLRIKAAAESEGIDLNPAQYSTSEAFRAVSKAIAQQPGSLIGTKELATIRQLGERGDDLITQLDGMLDRNEFDAVVRERMIGTIGDLNKSAEGAFKVIDDYIEPASKVVPKTSQMYMDQRLAQLGDDLAQLTAPERKLLKMLSREKPPTYNALDTLRRDIGDGMKNEGVFATDSQANLKQVYRVLIDDQKRAAKQAGIGPEFAAAQKLVADRKKLEKRAVKIFGRELDGSILPKLTSSATKMTKGDVSDFKKMMKALPKDLRKQAAATMLNDLYTMGAKNKGAGIGQGFANAYTMLEKNLGAKRELFSYLPKAAQSRFDALGILSQGIYRAKNAGLGDGSPTARYIMQALEDGTLADRITSTATATATRVAGWKAGGHFGAAMADKADKVVRAAMRNDMAADQLLSSPAFAKALDMAMAGKLKQADMALKRTESWQRWRNLLGEGTKAQLAAMGPIAWLTQQDGGPVITGEAMTPSTMGAPGGQ